MSQTSTNRDPFSFIPTTWRLNKWITSLLFLIDTTSTHTLMSLSLLERVYVSVQGAILLMPIFLYQFFFCFVLFFIPLQVLILVKLEFSKQWGTFCLKRQLRPFPNLFFRDLKDSEKYRPQHRYATYTNLSVSAEERWFWSIVKYINVALTLVYVQWLIQIFVQLLQISFL